jgi:predicted O-methyltransferase YrrM
MATLRFETVDRIALTYINDIKGTISEVDVYYILEYVKKLPDNARYVETGSYLGCSATIVALSSNATVWAHDIWTNDWSELKGTIPPPETENYFLKFYEGVLNNKLENRIIPIRGNSAETLLIHPLNSIDLAFIDGDHSYKGCLSDLQAIFPRMKPGSTILVHDCYNDTEAYQALQDFTKLHNLQYQRAHGSSALARIPIPELGVPLDSSA